MLNERERRALEEIEQAMFDADPSLAAFFAHRARRARRTWGTAALAVVTGVLVAAAVGLLLLGLVGQMIVVLAVAAWPAVVLRGRHRRTRGEGGER